MTEYVLRTGQPLLASDQQVEQMAADGLIELIGAPSSEWLGVPLKRGERTFGVLVIQSYQEDFHYSERDRELLIFVSQHIADALWRKQAENELKESQRFLAAVFNGIQDGISVLDRDLNILQVNQAMDKWYAHQLPLAGKKCFQAYHGRKKPCRVCPTLRAMRERTPQVDIVPLVGSGNQRGWLELHAFPLFDPEGERERRDRIRARHHASASSWRSASSRPRKWNPSACWPAASPTISTTSWAASWATPPG